MLDPSASNCSAIWKASSLVGVRTRECSRCADARRHWRIGRANAPVFPEPVSARPITSRPETHTHTHINITHTHTYTHTHTHTITHSLTHTL